MLAVVVDDFAWRDAVIRGDDHLNKRARNCRSFAAWLAEPVYGTFRWIHGPTRQALQGHGALGGRGLSRHGLPARRRCAITAADSAGAMAMTRSYPTSQAIERFNLESIGTQPARLDFKEARHLNAHYNPRDG